MKKRFWGRSKKGEEATLFAFENKNGAGMEVSDFGAILYSLTMPDRAGKMRNVILGHQDVEEYDSENPSFFGAAVGRNANRIAKGKFALEGKAYHLTQNNGENNLHSGTDFYNTRKWNVKSVTDNSICLYLDSPDGDQGYPGKLHMEVTYTLTDENELRIDYCGVPEKTTLINMTHHSFFNLNGHDSGDILEHTLWIDADAFTPTDESLIPTGEIAPVEGTPMDFREKKPIGRDIGCNFRHLLLGKGYDHNWVLNHPGTLRKVAELASDRSGIKMEVITDLPGMQVYTGNYLEQEKGRDGVIYRRYQGMCAETQYFPDAINQENFASPIFHAGETYRTTTIYRFGITESSENLF